MRGWPADPGTVARRVVLKECVYCGKFTRTPMDHGPGRCRPPLELVSVGTESEVLGQAGSDSERSGE